MDSYEEMIIPEVPKALPNEQLFIYVPTASSDNLGVAKFDNEHFSVDPDGTVHSMSIVTAGNGTISRSQWTDSTPTVAQFSIPTLKNGQAVIVMPVDDSTKQAAVQARLSVYPAPFINVGHDQIEFIRAEADNAPAVDMNFVYLVFETGSIDTRPGIALVGVDAYGEGGGGSGSGVDETAVRAIITAMLGNVANERQYSASNPPPYPVTSVNGKTGAVNLPIPSEAADVRADPEGTAERKTAALRDEVNGKLADYDKSTTVNNKLSSHNTSTGSHADLRLELQRLADRLNAALNSDDTSLDDLKEIVAYIKSNKTLIDGITSSKVNVTDIVDNLVTNKSDRPLSAAQGVALKLLIDSLEEIVEGKITKEEADRTYAKPSDIPAVPQTLPNPYALNLLGKTYNGASAVSLTVDELMAAIKTASGGVIAWIGDDNNIYVSGNLTDGTYKAYYEVNGEYIEIGELTLAEEETPGPEPATYTVTWVNHDGTVLETDTVAEGETPVYNGATPIKAADGAYTYTFSGWTPALAPATEDAVYTAVFEKTAYTNLLTAAGYKKDYKISVSSGAEASSTGAYVSGYIPIQDVDHEFYIKNITLSPTASINNIVFYDEGKTKLTGSAGTAGAFTSNVDDEGNGVYSFKPSSWAGTKEAAFFRFSCGGMTAKSIVTENEPL